MRHFARGLLLMFAAIFTSQLQAVPSEKMFLSGRERSDAVPWDFFCTAGRNAGAWVKLPVPSNWDVLGYGTLNYDRDDLSKPVEQGKYRHRFTPPAAWKDRRVWLVFEGVMTDADARLNGVSVGAKHQGGFYRFRYDVTALLKPGAENLLEVDVDKHSSNESVNRAERQADFWIFGGIYRPVYLEAVPVQSIDRVAIDARVDGAFSAHVGLLGKGGADAIEAHLFSPDGKPAAAPIRVPLSAASSPASGTQVLSARLASPSCWTAETPHLYSVELRLLRGKETVHVVKERFGFRTIEVREGEGVFVNGRRVVLKGCNRHSFRPDSGRCLSESDLRADIALIQGMNMNAVRMSHYPPDKRFLELCDELGLYVLDELTGWQKAYDSEVGRRLVEEMVVRDVNHPCILFWDNGNEGGWNVELDSEFARWDPQRRPVLHPWDTLSGVNTAHYLIYEDTLLACEGAVMNRGKTGEGKKKGSYWVKPGRALFMPTEFLHGLYDGGHGAGLEDYWKVMSASPFLAGGFLWVMADEGLKRPDTGQLDLVGNRAPDGIVGPRHEKEASYYTIRELWSPISVTDPVLDASFAGVLSLKNHYSFTDASACRFAWELRRYPGPFEREVSASVVAGGVAVSPSLVPGASGTLQLPLPSSWREADALALRIEDPKGRELHTWVWPVSGKPSSGLPRLLPPSVAVSSREVPEAFILQAGDLSARFDRNTGYLAEVRRGTAVWPLGRGPRPASGTATLKSARLQDVSGSRQLRLSYGGDLDEVVWSLDATGILRCDYRYRAEGPREAMGVVFDLPSDSVRGKRWLGQGPFRVWKNRMRGVTHGVWQNDFNDTITGWRGWVYPEFQGCFAGVRWMELQFDAGPLYLAPSSPDLFVQVLNPEFPAPDLAKHAAVKLPAAGLGLLHAIPPIGNKFHRADQTGPQGQRTNANGTYSGSFQLGFGRVAEHR